MGEISREINNKIGEANQGLQQSSLKLTYDFVNYLHLAMVHLIWKHFEESNFSKKMDPIITFNNKKKQQLEYFLNMTSDDNKLKMRLEAQNISDKILNFLKDYNKETIKKNIFEKLEKQFKKMNNRKTVQCEIDRFFFSNISNFNEKEILDYILLPEITIKERYENLYKEYVISAEKELYAQKEIFIFIQELENRLKKISSNFSQIFKEDYSYNEFFKIDNSPAKSINSLSNIQINLQQLAFNILMNLLEGNHLNEEFYIIDKLKFRLNDVVTQIKFEPINSFVEKGILFSELKKKNVELIEPAPFLDYLEKNFEEILNNFDKLFLKFDDSEKNSFKEKITVSICKQKCPFCSRICGEDEQSHKYHRCIFGHQIRAIGGVALDNGEASVSRCEDIADDEIIQFNGVKRTWLDCKVFLEKLENNPWKFNDLLNSSENVDSKKKFNIAWEIIGSQICLIRNKEKNINIKYVPYNHVSVEQIKKINPDVKNHYIFIIDSSGKNFNF